MTSKSLSSSIAISLAISLVLTIVCLCVFREVIVSSAGGSDVLSDRFSPHRRLFGFVHIPPSNPPSPTIAAPLPEPFIPHPTLIKSPVPTPITIPSPAPPAIAIPIPKIAPPPPVPIPAQPVKDSEWDSICDANLASPPVAALVIYGDYLRQHPETTHRAELQAFTESALDLLWWERIGELCDQRKELIRKIQDANASSASRARANSRIQMIGRTLAGMGYSGQTAPDLSNLNQLAQLRKTRPLAIYTSWKINVLESVQRTRGLLPWQIR